MPTAIHDTGADVLAGIERAAGDYPFDGPHVALAGSGARVGHVAVEVAAAMDVPLLLAADPVGDRWGWAATPYAGELRARMETELRAADCHETVALAGPFARRIGFRRAHRHARLALAGARVGSPDAAVVTLADVMLQALVAGDAEDAREIVRAELGLLAAPGTATERLRATLAASLAAGAGRDAVACQLHVAPRTVSYRLRRAEALLGHPIPPRRAELAAALRLFGALGP